MTFAEKLKTLRKQTGFSQEQLAEKLGVSRQAVTKWESDAGIPDIENITAVSALFDISIDELLSNETGAKKTGDFLFESITEYDIAEPKDYDMKFGGAKKLILSGYDGEKIRVRLASNTLPALQSDFKVRIDDERKRIDVDLSRKNGVTEAAAKEALHIFIQIPSSYVRKIECAVNAGAVEAHALKCDGIEFEIKTPDVVLDEVIGNIEINCNLDMNIVCTSLNGAVEINQISSTSRIIVPKDVRFAVSKKGIATGISFEKDGKPAEAFDVPDSDNTIELNGIKSELIICIPAQEGMR